METITIAILLIIAVASIAYAVYDVTRNKALSKRQRFNLIYMICILPILGSVIYFSFKSYFSEQRKGFKNGLF
ncbi:hypothetical protein CLV53_1457 [Sediminibacterium magnilacihabitans]|jgi:hypothetical protein|nr:hypothetical protein CLV53_1457 [Sediminibacterium magnilacihabitans]